MLSAKSLLNYPTFMGTHTIELHKKKKEYETNS